MGSASRSTVSPQRSMAAISFPNWLPQSPMWLMPTVV